jgi:N-dimethylarginine dimethylaminohydrolase
VLAPHATSEYGTLRRVVMRHAGKFTRDLHGPGVHPVLARQMTTSTWAPYSTRRVRAQQDTLIHLLRSRGVEVILLAQVAGCSSQHYTRDVGFVIDDILFMARLNSEYRRPESDALQALMAGTPKVAHLPCGSIEGGDVMLHAGSVLVGLSEETTKAGAEALQVALGRFGIDREVVPIRFATPGIVHLDDHFNVVAPATALIHRSILPTDQVRWFEKHFDLIDVTDDEALACGLDCAHAPQAFP